MPITVADDDPVPPLNYSDIEAIHNRLDKGSERMSELRHDVNAVSDEVTAVRSELAENTAVTREVRDLLNTWRAAMKVAAAIGAVARWVRNVVLAALALLGLYHAWRHGVDPSNTPPHK